MERSRSGKSETESELIPKMHYAMPLEDGESGAWTCLGCLLVLLSAVVAISLLPLLVGVLLRVLGVI